MKLILKCLCGCNDFEMTSWDKYAKCKRCGESIFIKDADFEFDFEEEKEGTK